MKKYLFYVLIIALFGAVITALIYQSKNETAKQNNVINTTNSTNSNKNGSSNALSLKNRKNGVLNVSDIQADPSSYKGTITINGVMAGVAKDDPTVFAIVNTAEVKACQSVGCGTFYLLVKYNGKLPQPGDEINVTGTLTGSGDNLIFNATEFKTLGNIIPKGGQ